MNCPFHYLCFGCHANLAALMPLLFPSTPAVRELVVSAGESVEVTLPRNKVELNAFVVPTPSPGKTRDNLSLICI